MDEQQTQDTTTTTNTAWMRHYYIGATIGTVLLLVILILSVILVANNHDRCRPSTTVPDMDAMLKLKRNIPSPDHSALANMIGYLNIYNKGFVPIVLTKFSAEDGLLTLTSNCATISWQYELGDDPLNKVYLNAWNLVVPDEEVSMGNNITRHICTVPSSQVDYPLTDRFSCTKRATVVCRAEPDKSGYARPLVELVVESLEFELKGDVTKIKKGEFSKQSEYHGCAVIPDWHRSLLGLA